MSEEENKGEGENLEKKEEENKGNDKEDNLVKMRKKFESDITGKDSKIEELQKQISDNEAKAQEKVLKAQEENLSAGIKKLAGDDEELATKMKFFLDNTLKPLAEDATEEDAKTRLEGAYTLASGSKPNNPQDNKAISSGAGAVPKSIDVGGKLSEKGQALANQLGITSNELNDNKLI